MKRTLTTLALCLAVAGAMQAQELTNFAFGRGQKPIISPEIQNDSVTFRLKADYATVVKLSGSERPGAAGRHPLPAHAHRSRRAHGKLW